MVATSTTIAISSSSAAIAAVNAARAEEAHIEQCKIFMPTFVGANATPDSARAYAECVDKIYPSPSSDVENKVIISGILISIIVGFLIGAFIMREDYDGPWIGGLFGAFILPIVFVLAALLFAACRYVFS